MTPGGLDRFHDEMAALDGPMVIVTAAAGGRRAGCLVGFHSQASIDPARYLVCVSRANHTYEVAAAASHLGVHFLREDQSDLAELFGTTCGATRDKFAGLDTDDGPGGAPVLTGCAHWFVGEVLGVLPVDDHVAFALAPIASGGAGQRGTRLLGFQAVNHLRAAHAP